jgi:hypothetical protein
MNSFPRRGAFVIRAFSREEMERIGLPIIVEVT